MDMRHGSHSLGFLIRHIHDIACGVLIVWSSLGDWQPRTCFWINLVLAFMFGPLVGLFAVCTWQTHRKNVSGSLLDRLKAQFAKSDSTHIHVCMLIRLLWSLQVAALKNVNFITGLIVIHICSCNGNNFGLFLKRAVLGFSVACQFVFDGKVVLVVSNKKNKKI